jgi:acetolactate synthase-1/2/3 large subunit/N2-(2-carboxyethyl)arginine synthase
LQGLHRLLENAQHPIVVCGGGALSCDIGRALASFIESRNIPLVTSLAAKGIVSDRHPLCLGAITKYTDLLVKPGLVKHVFSPVDLVLLVGYDLAEDLQPALWRQGVEKVVCRLDEFPNNAPELVSLDLDVFGAPIEQSLAFLNSLPVARKKELAVDIGQIKKWSAEACQETGRRLNPAAIVRVVRRHMADSDIVVSGVGLHKHYAGLFYEVYEPLTYIGSNGLATMGFGLPAAMGAKLARPEAQVVAICGDGGFHSASHELDTCARHQIRVKAVVFVDGAFGLIRHYQHKGTGRHADVSTRFSPGGPDFVKLAEANHCVGMRAESIKDFEEKFSLALQTDAPVVLAVPIEYPTF